MTDGVTKDEWLNALYMSQESMRFNDKQLTNNEYSKENASPVIVLSLGAIWLIFSIINGINKLIDNHKKKEIMKSNEFKKIEKDVNDFVKNLLDLQNYLKKNINKSMYEVMCKKDDKYKEIDFSKGVSKVEPKYILDSIVKNLKEDKTHLECEICLLEYADLEYDYDRFDGYDGDKMYEEIENVLNKLSKEWEKKNNNPKLKIDNEDRCEVINGDWIRSIYTYKL